MDTCMYPMYAIRQVMAGVGGCGGVCVGAEQILCVIRASLLPGETVWVCGAPKNTCYFQY